MFFGSMHLNTFCSNERKQKNKRCECAAETEGNCTVEIIFHVLNLFFTSVGWWDMLITN